MQTSLVAEQMRLLRRDEMCARQVSNVHDEKVGEELRWHARASQAHPASECSLPSGDTLNELNDEYIDCAE